MENKLKILDEVFDWQKKNNRAIETPSDLILIRAELPEEIKSIWSSGFGSFLNDLAIFGLQKCHTVS